MAHKSSSASLALTGALLLAFPTSTAAQSGETNENDAICLPPGGTGPVACGIARAGQTIRLRVATTRLPTAPIRLVFSEEGAIGQPARSADVMVPPNLSRDGGYEVPVPEELCSTGRNRTGKFEIQRVMDGLDQASSFRRSLGTITVAC